MGKEDSLLLKAGRSENEPAEKESLKDAVNRIEQEARMVLPGIQALFGFQLIAVFNQSFKLSLTPLEQRCHWLALALTALATTFALAPAAYHRQAEECMISPYFMRLASTWLTWALIPLMLGTTIDFYLIGRVINHSIIESGLAAAAVFTIFLIFWFVFPQMKKRSRAAIQIKDSGR